jgi:hypothetical protein
MKCLVTFDYPLSKPVPTSISFRPMEDINGTHTTLPANIISRLREAGNLVLLILMGYSIRMV